MKASLIASIYIYYICTFLSVIYTCIDSISANFNVLNKRGDERKDSSGKLVVFLSLSLSLLSMFHFLMGSNPIA